jgi:hypothetical protein
MWRTSPEFVCHKLLLNIIIRHIPIDEEVPEHDDNHRRSQGEVLAEEIWVKEGQVQPFE